MDEEQSIFTPLKGLRSGVTWKIIGNQTLLASQKKELCAAVALYQEAYKDYQRRRDSDEKVKRPKSDDSGIAGGISMHEVQRRYQIKRRTVRTWYERFTKFPNGFHDEPYRPLIFDETAEEDLRKYLILRRTDKKAVGATETNMKLNQLRNETRARRNQMPTVHNLHPKTLRKMKKRYQVYSVVGQQMNHARVVGGGRN